MARPIVDAILRDRPIARATVNAILNGAENAAARGDTTIAPADAQHVAVEVVDAMRSDPIAANNANMEPHTESRVVMGSWAATIAGLGSFFTGVAELLALLDGQDMGEAGWLQTIVLILFGGASGSGGIISLVGRLRDDLPPMYFRAWNPFSWLARRKEEVLASPAEPRDAP